MRLWNPNACVIHNEIEDYYKKVLKVKNADEHIHRMVYATYLVNLRLKRMVEQKPKRKKKTK